MIQGGHTASQHNPLTKAVKKGEIYTISKRIVMKSTVEGTLFLGRVASMHADWRWSFGVVGFATMIQRSGDSQFLGC